MNKVLFCFALLCFPSILFAQTGSEITGTVTDKQTGQGLAGASVAIKGSSTATITNLEGHFHLPKPTAGKTTLVISFVGYEEMEVSFTDDNNTVNVALSIDTKVGNEVVVSASRRAEKVTNAPASIQVIGVKDFDQFAGSNVGELVSKVQGIEYTRNGVSDITFNARGFHNAFNNRLLMLVDGRISTSALSGNLPVMNRSTMIKDDIKQMEVVVGPQSALYGPNAYNAVFNTITKDPRQYQGTSVSVTAGNRYQFSGRIRHASKINDKWAFKLTGEYSAGKEYNFSPPVYLNNADTTGIPEHNVDFDFRHIREEAQLYYTVASKTDIIISGGSSKNSWPQVTTVGRNQMRDFTYSFFQARLVKPRYYLNVYNTWGNLGTSYSIGAYTRLFHNLTNPPNNLPPEEAEAKAFDSVRFREKSQRINADAQYNYEFKNAGLFFVAGLNYQEENPDGYGRNLLDSINKIHIKQYGGVLQLEKKLLTNIRLIGAVRYDHHNNFGDFFSPKLGLTKSVGDGSLRITWGRAYAMPTIMHQYSKSGSTFGNGEGITYLEDSTNPASIKKTAPLKPEEVNTWEVGYKGTFAKKLFVDINYYNGRSKNFLGTSQPVQGLALLAGDTRVYPTNRTQFNTYFNYSSVRVYGIDAGFTYTFNKFISLAVKYSWIESDITQNDIKNDANDDKYVSLEETSLNAPNHRGLVAVNLQNLGKQKMFVNISARAVEQYDFYSGSQIGTESGKGSRGKVEWIDKNGKKRSYPKNFNWGAVGNFITIDLSAGYKVNQQVQLNLGITNLFNTVQREFVGSPSITRLIVFELKLHVPNSK